MASSFINIGKIGFWANDGFVEAMQLCLIHEIENSKLEKDKNWLKEYKIELAFQSIPIIFGGMSMAIEEFISNKERKDIMTDFIDSIISKIKNKPEYFTGNSMHSMRKRAMEILNQTEKINFKDQTEFNKYVNNSRWKESLIHEVKDNYKASFRLLKLLLHGEMKTTASSTIDYLNF